MVRENGRHLRNVRHRFRGHSLADPDELCDPAQFVVLFWQLRRHTMLLESRDPIKALRRYMIENNLAGEPKLKTIEKKIDEVVEDAMDFAR
ncbi:pyruvate dehydrogenase E1 component subunit alpha-3, chloroplastic [Fagus crenata]